jgi:hypothetical protein
VSFSAGRTGVGSRDRLVGEGVGVYLTGAPGTRFEGALAWASVGFKAGLVGGSDMTLRRGLASRGDGIGAGGGEGARRGAAGGSIILSRRASSIADVSWEDRWALRTGMSGTGSAFTFMLWFRAVRSRASFRRA